ncbi:MAG TPA: hypothetical protein VIJ00_17670, partial [Nakamurella sp.]
MVPASWANKRRRLVLGSRGIAAMPSPDRRGIVVAALERLAAPDDFVAGDYAAGVLHGRVRER